MYKFNHLTYEKGKIKKKLKVPQIKSNLNPTFPTKPHNPRNQKDPIPPKIQKSHQNPSIKNTQTKKFTIPSQIPHQKQFPKAKIKRN